MLLSVCIIANSIEDLQGISIVPDENVEYLVIAPKITASYIYNQPHLKLIELPANLSDRYFENVFLDTLKGDYFLFKFPGEVWSRDVIPDVLKLLRTYPKSIDLKYLEGFYSTDTRRAFVHEVNPITTNLFTLNSLFSGPVYFVPGIKFIWPRSIIDVYSIKFDTTIVNTNLRHSVFGLDVLSSMYISTNYTSLRVQRGVADFLSPVVLTDPNQGKEYWDRLEIKHDIWRKNLWSQPSLSSYKIKLHHKTDYLYDHVKVIGRKIKKKIFKKKFED